MKLSEIMKRAKFERGANNVILNMNLANIDNGDDIRKIYDYVLSFVTKMPKNSMSLLLDMRELKIYAHVEEQLTDMAMCCHKYFATSAIVVDSNTYETIKLISNKLGLSKMLTFHDVETANKYLVKKEIS